MTVARAGAKAETTVEPSAVRRQVIRQPTRSAGAFETWSAGMAIAPGRTMNFVDGSVKLFGVGSVAFGAWGLIHPKSLTGLLGDDPAWGRTLGARDMVVGLALLAASRSATPLPLGLRLASDLHDAIRLRERSPLVALGAAAIALWGAAALAGSLMADRTQTTGA
jgi:hypothetical protein